ncbi:MAG: gliding motility protein GldM [Bacteroidales bacterium]|jgi:gliding motility-associated protein GldM|nr:gliding motility protein GldM [Bacteroidales bacterium]
MGHGKETPRQKMIGMMYLVLTAMLALNVSKDILDAFVLVDEGLFKTTTNFAVKNEGLYNEFEKQRANNGEKVAPWQDKALTIRAQSDRLVEDMQQLKVKIVKLCDGEEALALIPTQRKLWDKSANKMVEVESYDINDADLSAKDNMDKPAQILILEGNGKELKSKIEEFRNYATSLVSEKHPEIKESILKSLDTSDPPPTKDGINRTWEANYFENIPMIAVITMLTKLQSDVRNAEAEIVQHLLTEIDAGALKVNTVEAIVLAPSNYILAGGEYQARVILAAYDSMQTPEVLVGKVVSKKLPDGTLDYDIEGTPEKISYDASGRAIYRRSASNPGTYKWEGILRLMNPDGSFTKRPFSAEYQVGKADAVISATKMNVFYIGVDNPVSISVSGVPASAISASMTNGQLVRSGSNWIAKPSKAGTPAVITVTANIGGQNKVMGKMDYRVKTVPNPVAKVAGKIGGKIDKATLAAQVAVIADMENFDFDLKFRVTEFTVSANVRNFQRSETSKSPTITAKQKELINSLSKGSKVYFEDIKVVGPDGSTRELPAISFSIN